MRGVGVLVGVAVSGVAGAWVTKLVVGSVTAPLFFFGAEEAPTLTPHWKLVLVGGGLLEAMVAALLLAVLLPSLSGYRIDVGPAFAAMLIGNMVAGIGAADHRRGADPRVLRVPADARPGHAGLRTAGHRRQLAAGHGRRPRSPRPRRCVPGRLFRRAAPHGALATA